MKEHALYFDGEIIVKIYSEYILSTFNLKKKKEIFWTSIEKVKFDWRVITGRQKQNLHLEPIARVKVSDWSLLMAMVNSDQFEF